MFIVAVVTRPVRASVHASQTLVLVHAFGRSPPINGEPQNADGADFSRISTRYAMASPPGTRADTR